MKRNVLDAIYDATFGSGFEKLSTEDLGETRVQVLDFNGNKMKATLDTVWNAVLTYFKEDRIERPWLIDAEGRLSISKPASKRSRTVDAKKPRQASDMAVKVSLRRLSMDLAT